jgi:hypothetical protein
MPSLSSFYGICGDRMADAAKVCSEQCTDYIGFLSPESEVPCVSAPQTGLLQTCNCMEVKTEQTRSVDRYSIRR